MVSDLALSLSGDMVLLARVAEAGSISGASRAVSLERTTVSRRIARLERRLGASLLNRSRREVTLTEAGKLYYQFCLRVISAAEDGITQIRTHGAIPNSKLSVELIVPDAGRFVSRFSDDWPNHNPGATIEYKISNVSTRSIDDGCDLAIQLGVASHEGRTVIRLRSIPQSVWVGPSFNRDSLSDLLVSDLSKLNCVSTTAPGQSLNWLFRRDKELEEVEIRPRFRVDCAEQCRDACMEGTGMALLPDYMCEHMERAGKLRRLMKDWTAPAVDVSAVQREGQYLNRNAQSFIDDMREGAPVICGN